MRAFRAVVAATALVLGASACRAGYGRSAARASARSPSDAVTVATFHETLAPHGRWIEYPPHGWVWTPDDVPPGWRPYTDGTWVVTDHGWTWASHEPWGWAPYHYGRWFFDPDHGWLWVPGAVWAPAWVAWHADDDWVGWAPLPPAGDDDADGIRFDEPRDIAPTHWSFVERRHLMSSNVRRRLVSPARNVTLLALTRDATRFEMHDGQVVSHGPDIERLERLGGRDIKPIRIVDADAPPRSRGQLADGEVIRFFRPEVHRSPAQGTPPRVWHREIRLPATVLRWRHEAERRRLEQSLARERGRLASEHGRELRGRARDEPVEDIRRRQTAEQQAFETHAGELRQVLERRLSEQSGRAGREWKTGKPAARDRDEHGA